MWVADFGEGIFTKMDTHLCHRSEVRICPEGLKKETLMYGNRFRFQDAHEREGTLSPAARRDSGAAATGLLSALLVP